ncbi:hypothetical protein J6590_068306 [Homalodisca vitripennis]|nr:hypothetical protein J6590_068306 [Homalodisca vitripennis]
MIKARIVASTPYAMSTDHSRMIITLRRTGKSTLLQGREGIINTLRGMFSVVSMDIYAKPAQYQWTKKDGRGFGKNWLENRNKFSDIALWTAFRKETLEDFKN